MKTIEQSEATATLGEYASQMGSGPLIVTSGGHPVAALVPIENSDLETVSLSTNSKSLSQNHLREGNRHILSQRLRKMSQSPTVLDF